MEWGVCMATATLYTKTARSLMSLLAVGLVLGLSLYSYCILEVVVCWLFFSLAFLSLAIVILAGVLACGACECVIHWASTVTRRAAPMVELAFPELHLKIIPTAGKLK
jgi:hypothetical protein